MMDEETEDNTYLNTVYAPAEATDFLEPVTLSLLVPLSIIYLIILIAGLLGNTSTCIVIARNRAMHTATNFYLFSLAISDLFLLIFGLPIELHHIWNPNYYPLGEPLCILMGLLSESSANATVLTITAFTVERYIAICRPFMSHTTSKLSRAVRIIIAVWVFAVCTALPQVMHFGLMTYSDGGLNKTVCTIIEDGAQQAFVISSFLFFVVPMSVIIVLYALIGFKLRTSRILNPEKQPSLQSTARSNNNIRYRNGTSQNKVIRMLVAVTLSFFLCWAPFHVQRLMAAYGSGQEPPSKAFFKAYVVLTHLAGILYYLSTAINPILYNVMSNKFRNAFRLTLSTCCRKTPHWRRPTPLRNDTLKSTAHRQRPLQRQLTGTTHLPDGTVAQRLNGAELAGVHLQKMGLNGGPLQRLRIDEGSESIGSPQSISNSSLKEFDEEMDQELATYIMYHVECNANAKTKGPPDFRHTLIRRATYN